MTPIAAIFERMSAAGCPADLIVEVIRLVEQYAQDVAQRCATVAQQSRNIEPEYPTYAEELVERHRARNRVRMRKKREAEKDVADVAQRCATEKGLPHTPSKEISPKVSSPRGSDTFGEPPPKRSKPKHALPDDWVPDEFEPSDAHELARMRDWAKANGIVRADWQAQWRNWQRKAVEINKGAGNGKYRQGGQRPDPIGAALAKHRANIERAIAEERKVRDDPARLLPDRRGEGS